MTIQEAERSALTLMQLSPVLQCFPMPKVGRHITVPSKSAIYPDLTPLFAELCIDLAIADPSVPAMLPERLQELNIIGPIGRAQLEGWTSSED